MTIDIALDSVVPIHDAKALQRYAEASSDYNDNRPSDESLRRIRSSNKNHCPSIGRILNFSNTGNKTSNEDENETLRLVESSQLRECIRKSEHDDLNYNHELRKLLACSISELDKNRSILWTVSNYRSVSNVHDQAKYLHDVSGHMSHHRSSYCGTCSTE